MSGSIRVMWCDDCRPEDDGFGIKVNDFIVDLDTGQVTKENE